MSWDPEPTGKYTSHSLFALLITSASNWETTNGDGGGVGFTADAADGGFSADTNGNSGFSVGDGGFNGGDGGEGGDDTCRK